ncbi:MAG: 3-deoxy-manno-octulosonate cytidylyltransferase [Silvanigrellales bacterium]|nr:3-deoxy-manno-octulosonate cytidylyltransferase [Silvanigrellales bacterium]
MIPHFENQSALPSSASALGRIYVAVPARLASTRLPEKPLSKMGGQTMVRRVAARATELASRLVDRGFAREAFALVAADDERVASEARAGGALCFLTSPLLASGTDRVHAALNLLPVNAQPSPDDLVLNVQGDEPFFSFVDVENLAADMLAHPFAPMGTLAFPRTSGALFLRPSVVKVETSAHGEALTFSRAPIPWPRSILGAGGLDWGAEFAAAAEAEIPFLHHLGVYAFRWRALCAFAQELPASALEAREGLEQMRALEAGWRIRVVTATESPLGIDTPEDLAQAVKRFETTLRP